MDQDRIANILRGIFSMLMLLAVFFLGFNAANWTNSQIRTWCNESYCRAQCFAMTVNQTSDRSVGGQNVFVNNGSISIPNTTAR